MAGTARERDVEDGAGQEAEFSELESRVWLRSGAANDENVLREHTDDPLEIAEILESVARDRLEGLVRSGAGVARLTVAEVRLAERTVLWHGDLDGLRTPAVVEVFSAHAAYAIPISAMLSQRGVSPFPEFITKTNRRKFRRTDVPPGWKIQLVSPLGENTRKEFQVRDISRGGLSFEAPLDQGELSPTQEIAELALRDASGVEARLRARVASVRSGSRMDAVVVGLSIEPASAREAQTLQRLLESTLYPTTCSDADNLWSVHEASGYLQLSGKQPADFARVRANFTTAARKLSAAPEVACISCWPVHAPTQATMTNLKLYQSSWLMCQLSKSKEAASLPESRRSLADMYLRTYESAQADSDTRWLLTYVQDAAPNWSKRAHVGLPQRYVGVGDAALLPFRALETDVEPGAAYMTAGISVRVADAASGKAAMRDLVRARPAHYLDALDLTEDRWDLAGPCRAWQAAGLERERTILIAYVGATRCAMAVLERAEPGCHLYGLVDCLRLIPLRPGGERAFPALLAQAHSWFHERGRKQFVYLEESPGTLPVFELGFRDLGGATLSILSIDRLPELMRHVGGLAYPRSRVVQ